MIIGDAFGRLDKRARVGPQTIDGRICIWRTTKKHKKTYKETEVEHRILLPDDQQDMVRITMPMGAFVFQVFQQLNIVVEIDEIYSEEGIRLRADDRLWSPTTFTSYAIRESREISAAGIATVIATEGAQIERGLSSGCVDHMAKLMISAAGERNIWVPAQVATDLFHTMGADTSYAVQIYGILHEDVYTVVAHHGHWILVKIALKKDILYVTYLDGEEADYQEQAREFGHWVKRMIGAPTTCITHTRKIDQQQPQTCGTVALIHLGCELGLWTPEKAPDQGEWHRLLSMFPHRTGELEADGKSNGSSEERDALWKLRDHLEEHGVPSDRTEERAMAVLAKTGLQKLQEALDGKHPWSMLKALCSQPRINFMLVKADELEKQIKNRAQSRFKVASSTKKDGQHKQRKGALIPKSKNLAFSMRMEGL